MCCVVLVSACAGKPPANDARDAASAAGGDYFIGSRPVYARLATERGGSWIVTDVTDSDAPFESGYLIRLNDLTPAFDTRTAECMPQVYPEEHRCNPAHPFRVKDAGVIDKIISGGIAVGTAGKVTDISQAYETSFDPAKFNRIVDEALVNTGLGADRRRLINLLDAYHGEFESAQQRLRRAAERLAESRDDAPDLPLDIRPSIDGLVQYYEGDIDFRRLLRVEEAEVARLPEVTLSEDDLLPCKARQCVAEIENALANLDRQIRDREDRLAAAAGTDQRLLRVVCDPSPVSGYLVEVACPEELISPADEPVAVPVRVTILSRDFEGLYPDFSMADEQLQVDIADSTVRFVKTSGEYLTLTAQTIYYNSQVNTTSLRIEIPPGITIARPIEAFASRPIEIESTYRHMTPDKASGSEFDFGFAARYRVASRSEEQTLHDLRAFNVGCVVSNRLRPGSCRQERVADAREGPVADPSNRRRVGPM
ncbi:MAG: hypothetical protein R3315_07385 [Woeseiaceae bacterium]|nr:hypothetical protein [Woeseiaceae bacterium]